MVSHPPARAGHGDCQQRFGSGFRSGAAGDHLVATRIRLAHGVHRHRRAWVWLARAVAAVLRNTGTSPRDHAGGTGAVAARSTAGAQIRLARTSEISPDVGDYSGAVSDRPDLVALYYLAAALSLQRARLQPETNRVIRVGSLCRGGRGG